MKSTLKLVPVILGPSATGKTKAALSLARLLNGEVISVDSRKVYQGLPIGTATPAGKKRGHAYRVDDIDHYLMSHVPPDQLYTAGDFRKEAEQCLDDISSRGKTPILAGGTGFYFKTLQFGLPELPLRDETLRHLLEEKIEREGALALHSQLKTVDPTAATHIDPSDRHKLIRALEVYERTGQPYSTFKRKSRPGSKYIFKVFGLRVDKDKLEKKIEQRSQLMVERGMLEETRALLETGGVPPTAPILQSFGFREAVQVAQGQMSADEFLPLLIKGTKAYAKRQRTWFRTQVSPHWIDCEPDTPGDVISAKIIDILDS